MNRRFNEPLNGGRKSHGLTTEEMQHMEQKFLEQSFHEPCSDQLKQYNHWLKMAANKITVFVSEYKELQTAMVARP